MYLSSSLVTYHDVDCLWEPAWVQLSKRGKYRILPEHYTRQFRLNPEPFAVPDKDVDMKSNDQITMGDTVTILNATAYWLARKYIAICRKAMI